MGVRIMRGNKMAVMYCSTTDWAFGPVIEDTDDHAADDRMQLFIRWLPQDARLYDDSDLERKYSEWLAQEDKQWNAIEQAEEDLMRSDD